MDLINDLGTDLALAFMVEKRFRQKIDSKEAVQLIDRVCRLLEARARRDKLESDDQAEEVFQAKHA